MELDARLKLERVSQTIVADRVVLGKNRLNGAIVVQTEQRFIDVAVKGFVDALTCACSVIEILRLVERPDIDGGVRVALLRMSLSERAECQRNA